MSILIPCEVPGMRHYRKLDNDETVTWLEIYTCGRRILNKSLFPGVSYILVIYTRSN